MKYYLISGEPSGDLHGANLMAGLKKADPSAEFRFWGGDRMAREGGSANLVRHYRQTSFFGFVNVIKNLRTILRQVRECKDDIAAFRPDAVILIDYPGFNMKIAKFAHSRGFRVFYYIAPKVWAWKEHRVKGLRKFVDKLFIIFPFEAGYFRSKGIEPVFCGNPLTDSIARAQAELPAPEQFRRDNSLGDKPVIALLAGSRKAEILDNLPNMAALAKRLPDYRCVVAGVSWLDRSLYDGILAGSDVGFVCDSTYQILHIAEAAVVTSGTATLETALIGVPEMVVFKVPWLYEKLKGIVLKIPYVSLVNINLRRECVREMITHRFDIEAAEKELRSILPGGSRRPKMLSDFDELRSLMGSAGVSGRVAERMVAELENHTRK